jgi:WD40 repeat protein
MALSPKGKIVAIGGGGGRNNVTLWNVETREIITKWRGHTKVVFALCWSADGGRVASGSWDGTARVWDVNSGRTVLTIGRSYFDAVVPFPPRS